MGEAQDEACRGVEGLRIVLSVGQCYLIDLQCLQRQSELSIPIMANKEGSSTPRSTLSAVLSC